LRRLTFKAGKKGDSVAAVAQRYRVSKAQVAEWNSVAPSATFAPGQTSVVMQAPIRKGGAKKPTTRMASGKSTVKPTSHSTAKTQRQVAAR
jgi:membrane-bound lytic murein transglycosylase D